MVTAAEDGRVHLAAGVPPLYAVDGDVGLVATPAAVLGRVDRQRAEVAGVFGRAGVRGAGGGGSGGEQGGDGDGGEAHIGAHKVLFRRVSTPFVSRAASAMESSPMAPRCVAQTLRQSRIAADSVEA